MNRTVIVLALLTMLSVASVSTSNASPVIGERTVAVSGWLSSYLVRYLTVHQRGFLVVDEFADDGGAILGGDADDYANGRNDRLGPETNDKREQGLLMPAGGQPAGSGARSSIMK